MGLYSLALDNPIPGPTAIHCIQYTVYSILYTGLQKGDTRNTEYHIFLRFPCPPTLLTPLAQVGCADMYFVIRQLLEEDGIKLKKIE